MTSLDQKLEEWFVNETNLLSTGRFDFPDAPLFPKLVANKKKRLFFRYIIDNVRSEFHTRKIRRILKVKRSQEDLENEIFPKPLPDTDSVRFEIAKSNEKRIFLKSSIEEVKEDVVSLEGEVQKLKEEINITGQKCAFLESALSQYKEKSKSLVFQQNQLSFICKSIPKEGNHQQFFLNLNFDFILPYEASDKNDCEVKYLLKQINHLVKRIKLGIIVETVDKDLKRKIDKMLHLVVMSNLLAILKKISEQSYEDEIQKKAFTENKPSLKDIKLPSEIYLRSMKLNFLSCCLSIKKIKLNVKSLLHQEQFVTAKVSSLIHTEKHRELLNIMAGNASLAESNKLCSNRIKEVRTTTKSIQSSIVNLPPKNLRTMKNDFHFLLGYLNYLLQYADDGFVTIPRQLSNLREFVVNSLFSDLQPTIFNHLSYNIEEDLKQSFSLFWSILERNDIIQPLMSSPQTLKVLSRVMRCYENFTFCARKVKFLKDSLSSMKEVKFSYSEDLYEESYAHYTIMKDLVKQTVQNVSESLNVVQDCFNSLDILNIVLGDWWEQGAQYIPDIEYEGKTLKMWLDLFKVVSDCQ